MYFMTAYAYPGSNYLLWKETQLTQPHESRCYWTGSWKLAPWYLSTVLVGLTGGHIVKMVVCPV